MKNLLIAIFILLVFTESGCDQQSKVKIETKTTEKDTLRLPLYASKMEWMELNNEWVPAIREVDKLILSGKKHYERQEYKESSKKIEEAYAVLKNKSQKNTTNKELFSASKSLKDLSKKIADRNTTKEEVDSVLYKVCDVTMKNCWVLINRQEDLWIPVEELQIHLDSTYYYLSKNDTLKYLEELAKAQWLINADSKKYCSPKGESISDKIRVEMSAISQALKKGKQATLGRVKENIAKTYFLKADNHYAAATQISLSYGNDDPEGNQELGIEIIASAFYLGRALEAHGISLSEKENFELENAILIGNDLLEDYTHPKEEILETIKDLGKIMLRYRSKFNSEII